MSDLKGWRYYNFALIPNCAPHEYVSPETIQTRDFWRKCSPRVILARWTENFDCEEKTSWWYVIKDTPFDINEVKAKRRYEIRKGLKNFDVHVINPAIYKEQLYELQVDAYSVYPKKYRPSVDKDKFIESVCNEWCKQHVMVFGAFNKESGQLCGYARMIQDGRCIHFESLKTRPVFEKNGLNAAIVAQIMYELDSELRNGAYICDGARNIQHETAFQDYLEKYFGFRKAYCHLRLVYNPLYGGLIKVLYALRGVFKIFDDIRLIHKLNGVLMMEDILRKQEDTYGK